MYVWAAAPGEDEEGPGPTLFWTGLGYEHYGTVAERPVLRKVPRQGAESARPALWHDSASDVVLRNGISVSVHSLSLSHIQLACAVGWPRTRRVPLPC